VISAHQASPCSHIRLARPRLLWQLRLVTTPILGKGSLTVQSRRIPGAAWFVLFCPATVVTCYLAWGAWVSARHPAWLYLDNAWWRASLRPGHDATPLIFVTLWLATALAYWWPRRRQLPDVGLVVVAAIVVIGAVLGIASLAPCRGDQSRTAVAAWVLSLYVGALEPRYGPGTTCPGQLPLALQIGRTVCLSAIFVGAIAAAAVLWRQPVGRLRARLVKDATILTGLDPMTIPLLHRLTSSGRPSSVVVIEPDRNHPLLEEAGSTGAQVVVSDPRSEEVLLPIVRGWRGPQLRYLFALRPDAAENEAILTAAGQVLKRSRPNLDRPPHLIARIDDPRHADVWRGAFWFEDAVSPQESTARTLVDHIIRTGVRQVLLCADSTLALTVLLELARTIWEQRGLARATAEGESAGQSAPPEAEGAQAVRRYLPERAVLLDERAEDLKREFLAVSSPEIGQALPVKICGMNWQAHLLAMLDDLKEDAAQTAVLITDAPSEASLHEAGRVARLHRNTPVFILTADGTGGTGAVFDRLRPFHRTLLVAGQLPEDSWTRISRQWHETYRLAHPADPESKKTLTRRPWEELDDFVREDNILQLRSVMAAAVDLGRHWVPSGSLRTGSMVDVTDGEVRRIAAQEHDRWYKRRRRASWRPPVAGEEDDDTARVNSNVRPWAALPEEARERACRQVRSQLEQLAAVGFLPALPEAGPPGAAPFQRIGEVRARRLDDDKTWQSTAGDTFTAVAGDWLVIDESGNERTIRDREFRASHIQLDGDRWRRTGTVHAWRVTETTVVCTMEGRAFARAGDWIVQGAGGERWPVEDGQFACGYVAINGP
jgi:hypothetical protein